MSHEPKADRLRTVTDQDICAALGELTALPPREGQELEPSLEAYRRALSGVSWRDLAAAVDDISRGALGHGYFPSPPELRIAVDRAAEVEAARLAKIANDRRWREEAHSFRAIPRPTPEAKARVQAMVDAFKRGNCNDEMIGLSKDTH